MASQHYVNDPWYRGKPGLQQNEGNPPTSLKEASQRGMKMDSSKIKTAPQPTTKEMAKRLVEAVYELPLVQSAVTEAQNKLERVKGEISRAQDALKREGFKEGRASPKAILVTTRVCQKVVTIRVVEGDIVVVEVLDLEDV